MEIVAISALRDNYIWALVGAQGCVVVDPGEAAPVEAFLAARTLPLLGVLLTHAHADHTGGAAALAQAHGCEVAGPALAVTHRVVSEGERLQFAGFAAPIEVLATPGHTPEHLSYLASGALFCGDTLFGAGCGRLLGGTAAQLFASLQHISQLPADTAIYAAHEYTSANLAFACAVEPENAAIHARMAATAALRAQGLPSLPSRLADEWASNPFLRCEHEDVMAAVRSHSGQVAATPLQVFTQLRAWKDCFQAPPPAR